MKPAITGWKADVLCLILLLGSESLVKAQEVQPEIERLHPEVEQLHPSVEQLRQEVRELQQEVRTLRKEVWKLQQNTWNFRQDSLEDGENRLLRYYPGGVLHEHRFIHRLGVEARPQFVFPTNPFLQGENEQWKPIRNSFAAHVRYSFQFRPNTCADRVYGGAYQGIGLSFTTFGDKKQLGDPFTFYLFQGARLARFNPRLSLNYEWNFGLSTGWKPYDDAYNFYNGAVGSKMNAYINAGLYLNWAASRYIDLNAGVDLTHFSNGNTKFPNAGINTTGLKIGLVYNFNREESDLTKPTYKPLIPPFPRHLSYDLVLFGSWRRKGVFIGDGKQVASPNVYPVAGFNFAPMFNLSYKFRFGVSLDGVYDGSANVYIPNEIHEYGGSSSRQFMKPGLNEQLALGLSGRAEYVMPYFTIGVGMGANIVGKGDLKGFYQVLALKVKLTRVSFLHVGYNLQNFNTPNYLMLGLGFRFHDRYPRVRH